MVPTSDRAIPHPANATRYNLTTVSYTHLDVYKRQGETCVSDWCLVLCMLDTCWLLLVPFCGVNNMVQK